MNPLNILIIGNYDDLRGDSAEYLLDFAPTDSCVIYFSGTTGSFASVGPKIKQLNWNDTPENLIYSASINDNPFIDAIIYHQQEYGDWQNQSIIDATFSASNVGIPVFTQHYNDVKVSYEKTSSFYGFAPTINIGWGNYLTLNSGSYGNELEFYDTVEEGLFLTSSMILYGNKKGLLQTEGLKYLEYVSSNINELNAVASVAAKYVKLVQVLSSSYVDNGGYDDVEIYTNYVNNRKQFYYDARQYLRQISTNSASIWTPEQSFGMIQLQNRTGSSPSMPDITSGINLTNLSAGTPLYINLITGSNNKFKFTWSNYAQSAYKETFITIDDREVYRGNDESYEWIPDVNGTNLVVKFYTSLINGNQSIPESNSIIIIPNTTNLLNEYLKLNFGYSCANNGKYIAVGSVPFNKKEALSGVVDVLEYSNVTNEYEHKFLIKNLVNLMDYNLILSTEDSSVNASNELIGKIFITTEESSSFDTTSSVPLGTEQSSSYNTHKKLQTDSGGHHRFDYIYTKEELLPYNDNPLNILVDSLFSLITGYSDKFGVSLDLNGDLLAVGCPYFYITFKNGETYSGGSVEIYDLTKHVSGSAYYPVASIKNNADINFGEAISFCSYSGSLYLAVGSSIANQNGGVVYIYKRNIDSDGNQDNTSWSLIQGPIHGDNSEEYFGGSLKFDTSGTCTLVIGNSDKTNLNCKVHIYEKTPGEDNWVQTTTLISDLTIPQTLPNLDNIVPITQSVSCDGFGNSVSIHNDMLIVGAPMDTIYKNYASDPQIKHRGAVYFYERCKNGVVGWKLLNKNWGNAETLIDNKFGYDVDIYGNHAIVSVPRYYMNSSKDYILNTLTKRYNCGNDGYFDILGQTVIYQYNDSTWDIKYTEQKVKEYLYPYLYYGFCNALYGNTFVVGAPCFMSDYRNLEIPFDNNIQGYAFIYNINNLLSNYAVGNVFYRDGKIIMSNSGSRFDKLMKDPYNDKYTKYDLYYKSKVTLYEKQILCTINPNEFNYSTNPTSMINNSFFGFKDLDFMLKYMNMQIYGNQYWWNYINLNEVEYSLFTMYTENYDVFNTSSIANYLPSLSSSYLNWDVDGNDKINLNDMTLIWKNFTDTLDQPSVFKCIDPKSTRKSVSDIKDYIKSNVTIHRYGQVNPLFFEYDYSSSIDRTGSYLAPYITSIGLYSGADIVGVAKLAMPIKNSGEFPLNILVKWDY